MRAKLLNAMLLGVLPGLGWVIFSNIVMQASRASLWLYAGCLIFFVVGMALLVDLRQAVERQRTLYTATGSRLKAYWLPLLGTPILFIVAPAFYALGIAGASTYLGDEVCVEMTVEHISRTGGRYGTVRGTHLAEAAPLFDVASFLPKERALDEEIEGTRVQLTGSASPFAIDVKTLRYTDRVEPEGVRPCEG